MKYPTANLPLLWAKTDRSSECWTWTGSLTEKGYGQLCCRIDGKRTRFSAHRVAFEAAKGTVPDGMIIDHICRNRACINPDHLRAVSVKQNNENLSGAQARNMSRVRGVTFYPRTGRWRARVIHERQEHRLGYFTSLEDAERAVVAKRLELFTHNELDRSQKKAA